MKLTRKKAIALCIELWTWLAKTGQLKKDWPEWGKYDPIRYNCWFCEYDDRRLIANGHSGYTDTEMGGHRCEKCPFQEGFNGCYDKTIYRKWEDAATSEDRKKYAKLFLGQIKSIEQGTQNDKHKRNDW